MKRISFSAILFCFTFACSPRTIDISASARGCLKVPLSSETFPDEYFAGYSLILFDQSGRHDLEVQLEIRSDGNGALVGFSPIGNREFSVSDFLSGPKVEMSPLYRAAIAPEFLLLLFRLTLSPLKAIGNELSSCGIAIAEEGKLSSTRIFRGLSSGALFVDANEHGDIRVFDLSGKFTLIGKRHPN